MRIAIVIVALASMFFMGCDNGYGCQTYRPGVVAYCGKCGSHCIICMHNKWKSDPCNPYCDDCGSHNIIRMRESDYYNMKNQKNRRR